jgi:vacuolar-type H+-ATPase subunit C/Vma6
LLLPQIMRNTLYKAYLDDFAAFCNKLGGTTAEVMSDLLAFEADRRALNITLNSIGTGESACITWQELRLVLVQFS